MNYEELVHQLYAVNTLSLTKVAAAIGVPTMTLCRAVRTRQAWDRTRMDIVVKLITFLGGELCVKWSTSVRSITANLATELSESVSDACRPSKE